MPKPDHAKESLVAKNTQKKPQLTRQQTGGELRLAEFTNIPTCLTNRSNTQGVVTRLGTPYLPAIQRQILANRIGQVQGNMHLQQILSRNVRRSQGTEPTAPVQSRLSIGQANDQFEQEADRVAEQVIGMTTPGTTNLQRQEKTKHEEPSQAKCKACEQEENIQRFSSGTGQIQSNLESQLNTSKGEGRPLSDMVRSFMEPRFGANFKDVRVHTDNTAIQMNRELNAQAFTYGQNIYFGVGKVPGKDTLTAHELTHVVQQTDKTQMEDFEKPKSNFSIEQASSIPRLQMKHLSIPEAVINFRDVVTPSNETTSSPTLVESGQFYWTQQISFVLLEYIKMLKPMNGSDVWQTLLNWIESTVNEWPHNRTSYWSGEIRRYLVMIRQLSSLPENAVVIPFLGFVEPLLKLPSQKGEDIYYQLWGQLNQTDLVPNLDSYRSLPTLQAIWEWENQACGYTGSIVANRFKRKGGVKKKDPDAKRRNSTRIWANFSASANRDMRPDSVGFRRGDVLIQNGVSSAIPKMQMALDDGWILHARVLSGIDYGHGDAATAFDKQSAKGKAPSQPQRLGKPSEEHSIMIIGYDGDEFVFWDPDSASSNRRGNGFGTLVASTSRLSTAKDDNDIVVDIDGNHHDGNHRYQIIHLGSQ